MPLARFKIWDYAEKAFAQDSTSYVRLESLYSPADKSFLVFPVLLEGINACLLSSMDKKDVNGIDIFEGDRLRFYSISKEMYLQESVVLRSGLYWMLGVDASFEDALNLEIIGHVFDGKEDSDLFKLFHNL